MRTYEYYAWVAEWFDLLLSFHSLFSHRSTLFPSLSLVCSPPVYATHYSADQPEQVDHSFAFHKIKPKREQLTDFCPPNYWYLMNYLPNIQMFQRINVFTGQNCMVLRGNLVEIENSSFLFLRPMTIEPVTEMSVQAFYFHLFKTFVLIFWKLN